MSPRAVIWAMNDRRTLRGSDLSASWCSYVDARHGQPIRTTGTLRQIVVSGWMSGLNTLATTVVRTRVAAPIAAVEVVDGSVT